MIHINNIVLLAVPEAVLAHNEVRSKSVRRSIFCVVPCCHRGSFVPYNSEENHFHLAQALKGGVAIAHSTGDATNPQEDVKLRKITFQFCVRNANIFNWDQL